MRKKTENAREKRVPYGDHLGRAHLIFRVGQQLRIGSEGEILSSLLIQLGAHLRYLKMEQDGNEA
jgi:hypothetical protein